MDPDKMTGEPNQQSHNHPSSVFNFEPYPPYPINWNQANPFARSVPISPQFGSIWHQPEVGNAFSTPGTSLPQASLTQSALLDNPTGFSLPGSSSQHQPGAFENTVPHSSWGQAACNFSFGHSKPSQDVVQFPFQIEQEFGQRAIRCKRKTESPPTQLVKQHITEEKMAEHMSRLHISSETAAAKETESGRMQRLYMCEEMRKLRADSIIPTSILTKINQPCKALVLWKPPTRLLPPDINNEVDENENNNVENVPSRENDMESEIDNDNSNMDMDS